ncbi:MAG: peptidylprolyl isomerase [Patescibacteria group bacterium]
MVHEKKEEKEEKKENGASNTGHFGTSVQDEKDHKAPAGLPGTLPVDGQKKKKKSGIGTKLVWGLLITVVVIAVAFLAVVGIGIYKYGWTNSFIDKTVSIIPFPAALVDGNMIRYDTYQADLDTLDFFYNSQAAQGTTTAQRPSDSYIEKSVLSRLIQEHFISDAARQFSLNVTDEEIDQQYNAVVQEAGTVAELESTLKELYDWSSDQFKQKIILPYMERVKLQTYIASNAEINAEKRALADEVLQLVRAGEEGENSETSFADLAQQYSADSTAANGGDLGFFGRGVMVQQFEDAAFALEVGEVSDVVTTQYGYHIIKLLEVTENEEEGEQRRAAHILIPVVQVDEWMESELADRKVRIFESGLVWNNECGLVLGSSETCDSNELVDFAAQAQLPVEDLSGSTAGE